MRDLEPNRTRTDLRALYLRSGTHRGPPRPQCPARIDRRRTAREQRAREQLGGPGLLLARLIKEPQSTRAWQQGARGEVRTAERLEKHLHNHDVRLLHDRLVPGHGRANIDHIAVGPAGILVIDSKTHRGQVCTDRVGGLFAPRRQRLLIDGRDQTGLIDGVERQIGYVQDALRGLEPDLAIVVRGALCFPSPDGLPLTSQLRVRGIVIDGLKPIAKLAREPGPLKLDGIGVIWRRLAEAFPPA